MDVLRAHVISALVVVAFGAVSGRVQDRPPTLLPPVAFEAADRGPLALAFVLSQLGQSAGVVTSENPSELPFADLLSGLASHAPSPSMPPSTGCAQSGRTWRFVRLTTSF